MKIRVDFDGLGTKKCYTGVTLMRKKKREKTRDLPRKSPLYPVEINERSIEILLLAHPRQIAKLGRSSQKWYELHQAWLERTPSEIIEQ